MSWIAAPTAIPPPGLPWTGERLGSARFVLCRNAMRALAVLAVLVLTTGSAAADAPADDPRGYILATAGIGAPTGLLGGSFGLFVSRDLSLEAGAGIGLSGGQFALLVRVHHRYQWLRSFSVAAGPSISMLDMTNETAETDDELPTDIRIATGINGEIAFDAWSIVFPRSGQWFRTRIAVGVYRRLYENMSQLCTGASGEDLCGLATGDDFVPEVAELDWFPYVSFGIGAEF